MALSRVAWIGRLTGPKGEIATRIVNEVAPQMPDVEFTIVGGPVETSPQLHPGGNVKMLGFVPDVNKVFRENDVIIGAGRVAVEAMRAGYPVIAVGENRYIGPVNEQTIAIAKATNFGDCDLLHTWTGAELLRDLEKMLNGQLSVPLEHYRDYLSDYAIDRVYPQVIAVYREAIIDDYLARFREIPVLTYHRVLKLPPAGSRHNIYVTVDELEAQIISLKRRGFEFVTFKDIVHGAHPKKPVILTFDDGYKDNFENLLPLLERYGARAVIYVLGDRGIRNNYWDMADGEPEAPLMNDAEVLACHHSGLVEIASHGMTHARLSELSDVLADYEIRESRQVLEKLLGAEVVSFAYPYGEYGPRNVISVRETGYAFGVGTVSGPVAMVDDRMRVRRITMFPGTTPMQFRKKTSGWYLRYCKLKGKDF
ncbi:MAG: polysaccharide deacetylase family protein [Gammaproteobacteria bacterium]|nr:polysaccharide deacetylase family protein [Gammaproteobacteria bacterium]